MSNRPSGDAHWTRARPELLPSWTKLKPAKRAELIARVKAGEVPGSFPARLDAYDAIVKASSK